MNATKGYFSLVQFCPDPSRLEAVNVGVVLFCPDANFIAARMTESNARARQFFGPDQVELAGLASAKVAFQKRFEVERQDFRELADLQNFVATRAGNLQLTAPRPVKVFDAEADLQRLFDELVGGKAKERQAAESRIAVDPRLHHAFEKLAKAGRARLDHKVAIPVLERELQVPYAYQNGVWNLVKPHHFAGRPSRIVDAAIVLAGEGDLLQRATAETEEPSQLIVVPSFDADLSGDCVPKRVMGILGAFHIRTVSESDIPKFVKEVQKSAH